MNDTLRYLAVFVGGAAGSLVRWGVASALPSAEDGFGWGTFVANVSGAFGLCFVVVFVIERTLTSPYLRPLVAIGFFGSYTTFSLMALDGIQLVEQDLVATAVLYWVLTFVVGQIAAMLGIWTGSIRPAKGAEP